MTESQIFSLPTRAIFPFLRLFQDGGRSTSLPEKTASLVGDPTILSQVFYHSDSTNMITSYGGTFKSKNRFDVLRCCSI